MRLDKRTIDEITGKPSVSVTRVPVAAVAQRAIEVDGDRARISLPDEPDAEGTALAYLQQEGLDPAEWEVTGFRKGTYRNNASVRFTFKRKPSQEGVGASLSDAELERILSARPSLKVPQIASQAPGKTYLVALGDMQFGKGLKEGDTAAVISRTLDALDRAHAQMHWYAQRYQFNEIVIAFLGDHIEGFNSQGGATAWRTPLPLTDQIRITRRVMLYAMELFAPYGLPLKMVGVPGNHGEAVRFGKSLTTYDDSHDTEALIAVHDAAKLNPQSFGHVEFFVPQFDELSVALNLNGTNAVFTHGHQIKAGRHHEWVKGQAYNRSSVYSTADLVMCGHYHHFLVIDSSDRRIVQIPTLESESQWFKHMDGAEATRGIVVGVVGQGRMDQIEMVYSGEVE